MRQAAPGVSAIARQGLVANGDVRRLPPAIVDLRQHHAQLAVHEARGRPRPPSNAEAIRTARAKRPDPRSTRW